MVRIADIRKDLPDWPDDVIDPWLLRHANRSDLGWPPPDPIEEHGWTHLLGDKPLSWWKNVSWKLEDVDCAFENLSGATKYIVAQTTDAHVNGAKNNYGGDGSKRTFDAALRHLLRHGTFSKPLIGMRIRDGLSILDGNHRISAHVVSQQMDEAQLKAKNGHKPQAKQKLWIGTHSAGEVLNS